MTVYQWADGFHPPKRKGKPVPVEDVKASIDKLKSPTPKSLLAASKAKRHPLHQEIWGEDDSVWAARGRLERCRKIIAAIEEVIVVGGKELTVRSVEFVRPDAEPGRWVRMENIRQDPKLLDAYLREVIALQEQATAKLAKVRQLMQNSK